jgi:hypothetical protein
MGMFEATRCQRCKFVAGILKDSTVVHADLMGPGQGYTGSKSFVLHSPFNGALAQKLCRQYARDHLEPDFDTILTYKGQMRSGWWDLDFSKSNLERLYGKHHEPCPICEREIWKDGEGGSYSCIQCMTHICADCLLRIVSLPDKDGYGLWECPICRAETGMKLTVGQE